MATLAKDFFNYFTWQRIRHAFVGPSLKRNPAEFSWLSRNFGPHANVLIRGQKSIKDGKDFIEKDRQNLQKWEAALDTASNVVSTHPRDTKKDQEEQKQLQADLKIDKEKKLDLQKKALVEKNKEFEKASSKNIGFAGFIYRVFKEPFARFFMLDREVNLLALINPIRWIDWLFETANGFLDFIASYSGAIASTIIKKPDMMPLSGFKKFLILFCHVGVEFFCRSIVALLRLPLALVQSLFNTVFHPYNTFIKIYLDISLLWKKSIPISQLKKDKTVPGANPNKTISKTLIVSIAIMHTFKIFTLLGLLTLTLTVAFAALIFGVPVILPIITALPLILAVASSLVAAELFKTGADLSLTKAGLEYLGEEQIAATRRSQAAILASPNGGNVASQNSTSASSEQSPTAVDSMNSTHSAATITQQLTSPPSQPPSPTRSIPSSDDEKEEDAKKANREAEKAIGEAKKAEKASVISAAPPRQTEGATPKGSMLFPSRHLPRPTCYTQYDDEVHEEGDPPTIFP